MDLVAASDSVFGASLDVFLGLGLPLVVVLTRIDTLPANQAQEPEET